MKSLVVYYSYSGKTDIVARELAGAIGADVRRIEDRRRPPALWAYTKGCIDALLGRSGSIKPVETGMEGYDRVYVGSPVWAGRVAPALNAYVHQADFKGKTVILFATMGAESVSEAFRKVSDAITDKGGRVIGSFCVTTGGQSDESIAVRARSIAQQYVRQ